MASNINPVTGTRYGTGNPGNIGIKSGSGSPTDGSIIWTGSGYGSDGRNIGSPVYRTVLDEEAYKRYVAGETKKFEDQQLAQRLSVEARLREEVSKREQDFSVREKIKRQMEAGSSLPGVVQKIQDKREAVYKSGVQSVAQRYEGEYARQFESAREQAVKNIEGGRSQFERKEFVGYDYTGEEQAKVQSAVDKYNAGVQAEAEAKLTVRKIPIEEYVTDAFMGTGNKILTKEESDKQIFQMNRVYAAGKIAEQSQIPVVDLRKADVDYKFYNPPAYTPVSLSDKIRIVEIGTKIPQDISDETYKLRIEEMNKKINPLYRITETLRENVVSTVDDYKKRFGYGFELLPTGVRVKLQGTSYYKEPTEDTLISQQGKTRTIVYQPKKELANLDIINNPITQGVGVTYDVLTSTGGTALSYLSVENANRKFKAKFIDDKVLQLKKEGILNPKDVATTQLDLDLDDSIKRDFSTSKLALESGLYVVGGPIASLNVLGQASRAKDVGEALPPLVLGGVVRLAVPKIMSGLSGAIGKVNIKVEGVLDKYFGSKLPVPTNLFATRKFGNLIPEEKIAKAGLIAGGAIELAGLQVTPTDLQKEYIRKVGVFNAYVPAGYRITDFGIALGKTLAIKVLAPLKGFRVYKYEDLMGPETLKKFKESGGGTPVEQGDEITMIGRLQGKEPSIVAKDLGINLKKQGVGAGFRSIRGNIDDVVSPRLSGYESLYDDFFAPELHPIALGGVGLKEKLFKKIGGVYDRVRLSVPDPSIEYVISPRGIAISKNVDGISWKTFVQGKKLFGYKIVDKGLDVSKPVSSKFTVKANVPLDKAQLDKMLAGGRPFKTREPLGWIGKDALEEFFVDAKGSLSAQTGAFTSTQSRGFGLTSEAEVALGVPRIRIGLPETNIASFNLFGKEFTIKAPSDLFKRLGFADAYIQVKGEMVPMNIEKVMMPTSTSPLLTTNALVLTDMQRKMISGGNEVVLLTPIVKKVISKESGGLSEEMRRVFGGYRLEESFSYGGLALTQNLAKPFVSRDTEYSVGRLPSRGLNYKPITRVPVRDSVLRYETVTREPVRLPDVRGIVRVPDRTPPVRIDITRVPVRIPDLRVPPRVPDRTPPVRIPIRTPDLRVPPRVPDRTIIVDIPLPSVSKFKFSLKKVSQDAFKVVSRVGGKEKVLAVGLPKGRALRVGSEFAMRTPARSFKIERIGFTRRQDVALPKLTQFREPVRGRKVAREGFTYVEKSKYAIDSPGEVRGITMKGLAVRKANKNLLKSSKLNLLSFPKRKAYRLLTT